MKLIDTPPRPGLPGRQFKKSADAILLTGHGHIMSRIFAAWLLTLVFCAHAAAQEKTPVVRLARLQIDSAQLETYKAALKEEIETSVRVEPGVLTLYAVSEKENPTHITVFEIYSSADAFKAHLETPHFKKYKNSTKEMVKSLEVVETVPIALSAKKHQ
jgi:quinol monooxygenase YgiN